MRRNKNLILILFLIWVFCSLSLAFFKARYKPDHAFLQLSFVDYSCDNKECDIIFSIKNSGRGERNINYFITIADDNAKYLIKEDSIGILDYDEKTIEETITLSDYSGKELASLYDYEIHFYEDSSGKTLKIGVGIV